MGLFVWTVIGIVAGFTLSAVASRKFNHRIAPAAFVVACLLALGIARWAEGQASADAAKLQAEAFIVGCALLGAVAGGVGWLIFKRMRWAMLSSGVALLAFLAALPLIVPALACAAAGICM